MGVPQPPAGWGCPGQGFISKGVLGSPGGACGCRRGCVHTHSHPTLVRTDAWLHAPHTSTGQSRPAQGHTWGSSSSWRTCWA